MAFRYLAFHKPFNVLCQFTGDSMLTLADFISVPGVYPVGRLDADSEGLLLLTDDGVLQHKLSDPKFGHKRTYWAQVEGVATEEALRPLLTGVSIQDYRTKPAQARVMADPSLAPRDPPIRVRKAIPTSWLEIVLAEGRNRQVRRMTAAVGLPTLRLLRVAIDVLELGNLAAGAWRDLTAQEVRQLRAAANSDKHSRNSTGGVAARSNRS